MSVTQCATSAFQVTPQQRVFELRSGRKIVPAHAFLKPLKVSAHLKRRAKAIYTTVKDKEIAAENARQFRAKIQRRAKRQEDKRKAQHAALIAFANLINT